MDKQKILIIGLVILVISVIQYLIIEKFLDMKQQEISKISQTSYDKGADEVIKAMLESTKDCTPVSVVIGNDTKQFIDLSCIKNYSYGSKP